MAKPKIFKDIKKYYKDKKLKHYISNNIERWEYNEMSVHIRQKNNYEAWYIDFSSNNYYAINNTGEEYCESTRQFYPDEIKIL